MKFPDNWAVCIFGDRFLIETTNTMLQRLQSNAIYSDHGSYSHIPHWLVIRTYNIEYVTITAKLCRFATHRSETEIYKHEFLPTYSQWVLKLKYLH